MTQIIRTTFQFKRGDAERWNELNPILAEGEPGFELDTNQFKIGNGINTWKELPYKGEANIVNAQTRNDFPTHGNENAIYKAQDEKLLYQWNPNIFKYEVLGTFGETDNGDLITIDTELSTSSMNPVANKVITMALQDFAEDHYTKQEVDTAIENTNKRIDLLEGTTHFRGIYPNLNDETLNADLYEFSAGDIFIVENAEYICTTSGNLILLEKANYEKLGDVSAEIERISALEEKVGNEKNGEIEATGLYQAIAGLENTKVDKTDIINTLDSTALDKPLSAAMGKELNSLIKELSTNINDAYVKQTELNDAVNTALETAKESGELDGQDGGHYTPSVKDNGNGTITVTFTASESDMPDVSPVTISLPVPNNGKDGDDGGYYTPSINIISNNEFKISFTASKSGMPSVADVTITLPVANDGDDGVGIESVVQTTVSSVDGGENVITVTLTNGNKTTFKVKNGSEGSTGKTAFQYAKEAGYTGSEEEFSSKLANNEVYFGNDEVMPDDCNLQIFSDGNEEFGEYAPIDHNHDGVYATPEQVQAAVESATAGTDSFIIAEGTGGTTEEYTPDYDNLANPNIAPVFGSDGAPDLSTSGWLEGYRTNSSGVATKDTAVANCFMSNLIPISQGQVLRIRGVKTSGNAAFRAQAYGTDKKTTKGTGFYFEKTTAQTSAGGCKDCTTITTDEMNGMSVYEWTAFQKGGSGSLGSGEQHAYASQMAYVRVTGAYVTTAEDVVITVDDPITYTKTTLGEMSYTLDEKVKVPQAIENAEKIASMQTGAVWYALGDSITEGYMSAVDSTTDTGYKSWRATSGRWVDYVAQLNGYKLTNKGVGATGYVQGTNNARAQVDSIDFSDCDLVTLAYGVNDWKYPGNTIGSLDDDITTGGTMVSNLRYIIKKILTDNPYCKIFVITPINCRSLGTYDTNWGIAYAGTNSSGGSLENIFTAIKSVCEYHGIEMIDMTHSSVVNRENIRTALADYVHPTAECHRVMGYELARKIKFA